MSAATGTPEAVAGPERPVSDATGSVSEWAGSKQHVSFSTVVRRRILHFTPSWFSVNMGTGITSILLYTFPFQFRGLHIIADIIFALNVFLFVAFLAVSILRYTLHPYVWKAMLYHPQQSLFLGTFPMGFSTIVNMVAFSLVPAWGEYWAYVAWALWVAQVAVAIGVLLTCSYFIFTVHKHKLESMTAVWLLPFVTNVVAAASGGVVASVLPHGWAAVTVTISYALLGMGLPISCVLLAPYLLRLSLHKLPPAAAIVTVFLPVGPCGQGAFGVLQLGVVTRKLLQDSATSVGHQYMADGVYAVSIVFNLILLGFGLFWLLLAIIIVVIQSIKGLSFNLGWWALTFPLGVYASGTAILGRELDSMALKVLGAILTLSETLLWIFVSLRTIISVIREPNFINAPCLSQDSPSRPQDLQTKLDPTLLEPRA